MIQRQTGDTQQSVHSSPALGSLADGEKKPSSSRWQCEEVMLQKKLTGTGSFFLPCSSCTICRKRSSTHFAPRFRICFESSKEFPLWCGRCSFLRSRNRTVDGGLMWTLNSLNYPAKREPGLDLAKSYDVDAYVKTTCHQRKHEKASRPSGLFNTPSLRHQAWPELITMVKKLAPKLPGF